MASDPTPRWDFTRTDAVITGAVLGVIIALAVVGRILGHFGYGPFAG